MPITPEMGGGGFAVTPRFTPSKAPECLSHVLTHPLAHSSTQQPPIEHLLCTGHFARRQGDRGKPSRHRLLPPPPGTRCCPQDTVRVPSLLSCPTHPPTLPWCRPPLFLPSPSVVRLPERHPAFPTVCRPGHPPSGEAETPELVMGLRTCERGLSSGGTRSDRSMHFRAARRGMGRWGRQRRSGNLPHKGLPRLQSPRRFVCEPCSCLGHFHFYLLRMVSRSRQAGDEMLMTPAPRGDHSGKSCNVLSATLIRGTHQELLCGDSFPPSTCPAY